MKEELTIPWDTKPEGKNRGSPVKENVNQGKVKVLFTANMETIKNGEFLKKTILRVKSFKVPMKRNFGLSFYCLT